ncbi:MAG: hypothetical protein PHE47_07780 [Oscillospiraceae bacterium]|nr:hypothetical protein [Oscillospiraceae bacterium]
MSIQPVSGPAQTSDKETEATLLEQIVQNTQLAALAAQKQLLFSKIALGLTGFLTAFVLFVLLLWGPKLHHTLQNAERTFENLSAVADELAQADIPSLIVNMDQLTAKGQDSLAAIQRAAEVLEKIDMDQLNEAISDLQKAVSPLAKLFG